VCLAIPGRILEITLEQDLVFGQIEFDGHSRRVSLDLVPEAQVGDYVLVYAGFAMVTVQEAEAQSMLQLLGEMSELLRAPI
jgi:hydrogenase expression/formation protein HypC